MAASAQSRRPHVVTFICFWLLLGPAFSVKNLELLINRYKFRSDVYNHLAVALATFFVSPDVVFSCLDLAQQNAYATAWECALARQRVFASYGLYAEERATFERWRQQVPVVSWIYDEMVMAHVGSQFHHLQESMLEALVYKKIHRQFSVDVVSHQQCGGGGGGGSRGNGSFWFSPFKIGQSSPQFPVAQHLVATLGPLFVSRSGRKHGLARFYP